LQANEVAEDFYPATAAIGLGIDVFGGVDWIKKYKIVENMLCRCSRRVSET